MVDFAAATILIVRDGVADALGVRVSDGLRGSLSEAPQMIPLTLAMLRLIERIRLADIRMASPPGVEVAFGMVGDGVLRDGLSVGGLQLGQQ